MQGTDFAGFARSCAAVATGALGWPAGAFWDATWAELRVALDKADVPGPAFPALAASDVLRMDAPPAP